MDAESILDEIANEQGWNISSQLAHALEYIQNQRNNDAWEEFLKQKAQEENEENEE